MSQAAIRRWYLVHKWTSVVVTAFLLLLCITGLPLIFHVEIDAFTRPPQLDAGARDGAEAKFDAIVRRAQVERPGAVMIFLTWDDAHLDTHNLVGIATTAWLATVGFTGFVITMSQPITALWRMNELSEIAAPYAGKAPPAQLVSVDRVLAAVRARVPVADPSFIAWPGSRFSTPHHYMVALEGDRPLTKRLIKVAMVDARTVEVSDVRETPWYVKAVFLSVPLHFGDYGGLPLKIIWALLDLAAIVVLTTGLYLWLGRGRLSIERSVGLAGAEA